VFGRFGGGIMAKYWVTRLNKDRQRIDVIAKSEIGGEYKEEIENTFATWDEADEWIKTLEIDSGDYNEQYAEEIRKKEEEMHKEEVEEEMRREEEEMRREEDEEER
jgi:hypothetical protein